MSIENATVEVPAGLAARIWQKDPSAWPRGDDDPAERLGWLRSPVEMAGEVERLEGFAREVRREGVERVALLGMGGSSLAPEVFGATLGSRQAPALEICDSTHPGSVRAQAEALAEGTLFLVSSKSGGTVETMSLYRHFRSRHDDGRSFVAITDPGTALEELAREEGFKTAFLNPPDIGGRFSALSFFGLVPAAIVGANLDELLRGARAMSEACERDGPDNPGLALGAALGSLALEGRDKLTFLMPEGLLPFGDWVEQLIAESTGKHGLGIAPVVREPLVAPERYGDDRAFVHIHAPGAGDLASRAGALSDAGHPVISLEMSATATDVGAEMFRWEFATAVACSILGVNAFDQPDVEAAKKAARAALDSTTEIVWPDDDPDGLFDGSGSGELACLLAFAPPSRDAAATLEAGRRKLLGRSGIATSAGFGPRYMHSTGQLHKGGPPGVRALVILDVPTNDVPIPGFAHGFARLVSAQAQGDGEALVGAGKRVARTTWPRFERWAGS